MAALKDCAPLAAVYDEPAVLLLALPVMQAEPELFDPPPEPGLLLLQHVSPKDSPPITNNLIDFPRKEETVALLRRGLPEPFLPEPEGAVEEVVAEEAGGSDIPAVQTPVAMETPELREIESIAALIRRSKEPAPPKPEAAKPEAPKPEAPKPEAAEAGQAAVAAFSGSEAAQAAVAAFPQPAEVSTAQPEERKGEGGRPAVTSRLGETINLALEGRGWIFAGTTGGDGEIPLLSRTISAGETLFSFDGVSAGHYVLAFQIQDNQSGTSIQESVTVIVREAQVEAPAEASADVQTDTTVSAGAPSSVFLPSNLAQALEDPKAAAVVLPGLLSAATAEQQEELSRITEWYKAAGYIREYAMCLERYLKVFPNRWDNDFRYYELGRLYETDLLRNEKKARQYYATVVDLYPASLYYLDAAKRVRYLDRHFLNLR